MILRLGDRRRRELPCHIPATPNPSYPLQPSTPTHSTPTYQDACPATCSGVHEASGLAFSGSCDELEAKYGDADEDRCDVMGRPLHFLTPNVSAISHQPPSYAASRARRVLKEAAAVLPALRAPRTVHRTTEPPTTNHHPPPKPNGGSEFPLVGELPDPAYNYNCDCSGCACQGWQADDHKVRMLNYLSGYVGASLN